MCPHSVRKQHGAARPGLVVGLFIRGAARVSDPPKRHWLFRGVRGGVGGIPITRDYRTPKNEGLERAPECLLPGPKRTLHGYVAYYRS